MLYFIWYGLKMDQLPLTEEAVVQHALQVYLQKTYWKVLLNTEIDPRLWVEKKRIVWASNHLQSKVFSWEFNNLSIERCFAHPE